jgi:hypothetical protein
MTWSQAGAESGRWTLFGSRLSMPSLSSIHSFQWTVEARGALCGHWASGRSQRCSYYRGISV